MAPCITASSDHAAAAADAAAAPFLYKILAACRSGKPDGTWPAGRIKRGAPPPLRIRVGPIDRLDRVLRADPRAVQMFVGLDRAVLCVDGISVSIGQN